MSGKATVPGRSVKIYKNSQAQVKTQCENACLHELVGHLWRTAAGGAAIPARSLYVCQSGKLFIFILPPKPAFAAVVALTPYDITFTAPPTWAGVAPCRVCPAPTFLVLGGSTWAVNTPRGRNLKRFLRHRLSTPTRAGGTYTMARYS